MIILFIILLSWIGCQNTHDNLPLVVEEPLSDCMDYAHDTSLYGYCVYKHAETLPNIASVQQYCSQADKWSGECRQVWMMSQIKRRTLDELLPVCNQAPDCTLLLLDSLPHNDVLIQMTRCMKYTGKYRHDCVMHASQAWYFDRPPAEEVTRVAAEKSPYPEQMGMYIAARVACDGVGSCQGHPEITQLCERYVDIFQDKRECPNQHRRRKPKRSAWQ